MGIKSSMGKYKLDVRQGDRNTIPYFNGLLDPAVAGRADAASVVTAGKVYSLTAAGMLTPGVSDEGQIPFFGWSGLDINNYPDVQRTRGMPGYSANPAEGRPFYGLPSQSGLAMTFATIRHNAAAELSSTAFLITYAADTDAWAFKGLVTPPAGITAADYAPGTALTVVQNSAEVDAIGLLCPVGADGGAASSVIVGYVAPAGVYVSPAGYLTLAFTPAFIAGTTAPTLAVNGTLTGNSALTGPLT